MLKIDPNQVFEATAKINLQALQASFGIKCKLLHLDVFEAGRQKWSGTPAVYADPANDIAKGIPPTTPAVAPSITDRQWIDTWLVGFAADVTGPDGEALAFTPDNVTQLLNVPGAKLAVIDAFLEGYGEAETKNSVTPRAGS